MVEGAIKHLPLTNAELFGREAELTWLDACWRDRVFVASIVAWGGVGKTSLVTKWLAGMRDDEWRGAARIFDWSFYQQGTNTGSSDTFFAKALAEFGDPDPSQGSPWDKGERLAKLVRQKRTLLVLDGVEPMQYGPGEQEGQFKDPALQTLVKELTSNNNGFLLITSRIRLRDLDGLFGAKVQAKRLDHLSAEAGAQLLGARGAKGTEQELRDASTEYEGHALALTLLASYLEDVAKGDIRRRNEIVPLIYDERNGGHARRVMEAYDPWLGQTERAILRMLGLFDRPASESEVAALRADPVFPGLNKELTNLSGRDWNKAVSKLRRIGLIALESGNAIDAHPLVRQHFGEKLKRENFDAWREGHRRLYEFLRTNTKEFPETIAEMEPLYKAVVHGCLAGKHQEVLDTIYWRRIQRSKAHFNPNKLGAFGHEVAMLSSFFEPPWEHPSPSLTHEAQALVLHEAGYALRAVGRLQESDQLFRQSMNLAHSHNAWANAATAAANLTESWYAQGKLSDALKMGHTSYNLAMNSGQPFLIMATVTRLATVNHAAGRDKDVHSLFDLASHVQQEWLPDDSIWVSMRGFHYCEVLLDNGRDIEVREQLKHPEPHNDECGPLDIGLYHVSLGRAHLLGYRHKSGGSLIEAESQILRAIDKIRSAADQRYIPLGLFARAELHIYTRAFADARRDLDEAMTIATRCGFRLHECDAHLGYARLAVAEGKRVEAREHLEKARKIVEETGYHRRDGELEQISKESDKLPPDVKPVSDPIRPIDSSSPSMSNQSVEHVDLAIVVALQEEFRELLALCGSYTSHKSEKLTAYRLQRGEYQIVAAFVGDMGQAQASRVAERMIDAWHPEAIVVVGIAAGIHDDLRVGDVFVPVQAVEYMQDAKAVPNPNEPHAFVLVPGAPARRADFALMNAVRNLEFSHPNIYGRFVDECTQDLLQLVPDEAKRRSLIAQDLVRHHVGLLADGHVATGPVVGTAETFTKWIRSHDRNVKALEMESAGVFMSAQEHGKVTRVLAIRGISDYGDERKKALDEIGGGALRKYAMRNAVRLLFALLDAEALPRNPR